MKMRNIRKGDLLFDKNTGKSVLITKISKSSIVAPSYTIEGLCDGLPWTLRGFGWMPFDNLEFLARISDD